MRYPIRSATLCVATVVAAIMVVAAVAVVLGYTPPAVGNHSCSGTRITQINPGDDLDATVNADPPNTATTFCVHGGSYTIDRTVWLRSGDKLEGEPGTLSSVGPATKPVPVVKVVAGTNNVDQLIKADGSNIRIVWLDLSGATGRYSDGEPVAGTGSAIGAGSADENFLARYLRVHNNDGAGITNMRGRVLDSEFFYNTEDENFEGFIGSAIKGVTEFEAAFNYVHDEQGNGIWCDDPCRNDPARTNGYWVHDNLVVMNNFSGIRYENSSTTALIEDNELHGNSTHMDRGAVSVRDAQNALIRENVFGAKTIAGVAYPANADKAGAIRASDSGKSSRTNLRNVKIVNNTLHGEEIEGCKLPDAVVYCARNSRYGGGSP